MKCIKCGNELNENENYCGKCGKKVNEEIDTEDSASNKEPIKIKLNYLMLIIIVVVLFFGFLIFSSSKNHVENNVENVNQSAVVETTTDNPGFSGNIDTAKNTLDAWWNMMTSQGKITKTKSKGWQVYKQQVSPYINMAIKEFYVFENQDFAIISIGYDDSGNVINIKFSGIAPTLLEQRYNTTVCTEYHYIMFSVPQILKFCTNDEELTKYLQDEMAYCFDNNSWYLNERKQGFKFSIGGDENNYLNVEVCLEQYAQ